MKLTEQYDEIEQDYVYESDDPEFDSLDDYISSMEDTIRDEYEHITGSFLSSYYHYLD